MYVIAYDFGTTGVKTCLFSIGEKVKMVTSEYGEYGLYILDNGGAEQDTENGGMPCVLLHEDFLRR